MNTFRGRPLSAMFEVSPKQLGYFGSSQVIYTNLHSAFLVHGTVECSFSGS